MTEQTLFRLALTLQNQAPSTLNKYICKLAETVLIEYPSGLSLNALSEEILTQFNLAFSPNEISAAIAKKGKQEISVSDGSYFLQESTRQKLLKESPLSERLDAIISKYIETFSHNSSAENISALLLKYLYHCFNSNVDNLLSLFNGKEISFAPQDDQSLNLSNEEISIINEFISWENPEKDALIYSIVSTCYEYCMLTIKNDSVLSKELFNGKRFYLDANIIFRMAGINNEERQTVTKSFVSHCKQAGIKLYCTSDTLDEVYRVISAQIGFIRGIAGDGQPVSCSVLERINPSLEINDFYKLYYDWCELPSNRCGDYISFNRYLLNLVQDTLSQLQIQQSTSYKSGQAAEQYTSQVENLRNFKNDKRKWRITSRSSAETDVTNVLDIIKLRNRSNNSIWQTSDFIVSADQLLIAWANENYTGVPIVVLPSVWLSIILRYTGRTGDDYKSFCLFLTQRQHADSEDIIDPVQLLKNVNSKTNSTEIKEQIIIELTQNKAQYSFISTEDYDSSIDRAFDKVLQEVYGKTEQQINGLRNEMTTQMDSLAKASKQYADEQAIINLDAGKEKAAILLAKKQASQKVQFFRAISKPEWAYYIIAGLFLLFGIAIWCCEIQPVYGWVLSALPEKLKSSVDVFGFAWTIISAAFGLFIGGIKKLFSYLGSSAREQILYEKFYNHNMSTIKED